jgi:hypothetical protein
MHGIALALPFSPTKNVTRDRNCSFFRPATADTVNGYSDAPAGRSSSISRRSG